MAEHITLDTLMQSSGHTALQVQEPASVEAVRAQVEELSPEQKARVEEVKNSIDLMDSQAALQYGVGAQRNISSFSDNIPVLHALPSACLHTSGTPQNRSD